MDATRWDFDGRLQLYQGNASWHFITLPQADSDEIDIAAGPKGGFGSVRVRATIGRTSWSTSLFPSREAQSYMLPVKASVRRDEQISDGDQVRVTVELANAG